MEFDYKKLLITYLKHIIQMEGITYVTGYNEDLNELGLSDEEINELERLCYE